VWPGGVPSAQKNVEPEDLAAALASRQMVKARTS
jgi:hypothetical protein